MKVLTLVYGGPEGSLFIRDFCLACLQRISRKKSKTLQMKGPRDGQIIIH